MPAPPCQAAGLLQSLRALYRSESFLETHLLAETYAAFCPQALHQRTWRRIDALALIRLDELTRAREILRPMALGTDGRSHGPALAALVWSHQHEGNALATRRLAKRLPTRLRLRLDALRDLDDPSRFTAALGTFDPRERPRLDLLYHRYRAARRTRRPWLAGILSAFVPGAGQLYAGSWSGAAVSFVLNAVFITATAELAYHHLYFTAGAAAVAGSVFYLGGILNAADLAGRRNLRSSAASRRILSRRLLPEVYAP